MFDPTLVINNVGPNASLIINDEAADSTPFVVDAAGNVGIGTSSPQAMLDVQNSTSSIAMRVTNTGTNYSFLVEDSTSTDSTPFVINADGRVGIANASPSQTLDVNGVAKATQFLQGTDYLSPYQGFRNAVMNGDMRIAQRGTSFNGIAGGTWSLDRWNTGFKDSGITLNITQVASTNASDPQIFNQFQYYIQLSNTAFTTGNTYYFGQKIEDVRKFAGTTVTLSYWAKVSSGTHTVSRLFLNQQFGTGGSAEVDNIGSTSPTYTTTWTKFTQTISVPSIATKTIGTGSYLYLLWQIVPNANISIQITGVQLEEGSVATPFEQRPIGTELALCQRYYYQLQEGGFNRLGVVPNATTYRESPFFFPVTMRVAPTVTITAGTVYLFLANATHTPASTGSAGVTPQGGFQISSGMPAATAGETCALDNFLIKASAEL
jgi:hypothetical protein